MDWVYKMFDTSQRIKVPCVEVGAKRNLRKLCREAAKVYSPGWSAAELWVSKLPFEAS